MQRGSIVAATLVALMAVMPARAQNLVTQGTWEGFALRDTDNKFDRCVLYNRTVEALSASPYGMLGVTRDANGRIGLLVFYEPRMLTRGDTPVRLKLDQRAPISVPGIALSDFHVDIASLDQATVALLRDAKTIEATVQGHAARFEVSDMAGVIEKLDACVKIYGPKS
jgi:hypothetical protein